MAVFFVKYLYLLGFIIVLSHYLKMFRNTANFYFTTSGSRRPQPTAQPKPKPPPVPEPEPEEPTEDPDPPTNPRDEQCSRDLVFDAATSIRGDLYFFKNGYIFHLCTSVVISFLCGTQAHIVSLMDLIQSPFKSVFFVLFCFCYS